MISHESPYRKNFQAIQNSRKRIQVQEVSNDSPTIDKLISAINENPGIMTDAELGYHLKTLFVAVGFLL